jgi:hypothetical protein
LFEYIRDRTGSVFFRYFSVCFFGISFSRYRPKIFGCFSVFFGIGIFSVFQSVLPTEDFLNTEIPIEPFFENFKKDLLFSFEKKFYFRQKIQIFRVFDENFCPNLTITCEKGENFNGIECNIKKFCRLRHLFIFFEGRCKNLSFKNAIKSKNAPLKIGFQPAWNFRLATVLLSTSKTTSRRRCWYFSIAHFQNSITDTNWFCNWFILFYSHFHAKNLF